MNRSPIKFSSDLDHCPNFEPEALTETKKHFEEYTYANQWLDVLKSILETQRKKLEARGGKTEKNSQNAKKTGLPRGPIPDPLV